MMDSTLSTTIEAMPQSEIEVEDREVCTEPIVTQSEIEIEEVRTESIATQATGRWNPELDFSLYGETSSDSSEGDDSYRYTTSQSVSQVRFLHNYCFSLKKCDEFALIGEGSKFLLIFIISFDLISLKYIYALRPLLYHSRQLMSNVHEFRT